MDDIKILDLIHNIKKKCAYRDSKFFKQHDITQAEYNMLFCLKNCKVFNSYVVADKMQLSLSRVSRIIDKMVSKGFLYRTVNEVDRRAIDIELSAKGFEALDIISQYRDKVELDILQQLSPQEAKDIKSNLEKLKTVL